MRYKHYLFVCLLNGVPLGSITQNIPSILLKNRQVNCFVSDCEKKPYQDSVCVFSALAHDLYGRVDFTT